MSESPWSEGADLSLTLKHDGKYEAPWLVFRGTAEQIKAQLIEVFGLDPEAWSEKPLGDLYAEADKMAKAVYAGSSQLGGRVIKTERRGKSESASDDKSADESQQEEKPAAGSLEEQIAATTTVKELKTLWAQNQEAFKDGELMAIYKARGKELQDAA